MPKRIFRETHIGLTLMMAGCLLTGVLTMTGCETLRKKFHREKKDDKKSSRFIPVLEPVEYPSAMVSAQQRYLHHYNLWKVWHRDLISAIEDKESDKKQKYILGQAIVQLEEMSQWIIGEQQLLLVEFTEEFREVLEDYKKPSQMRNTFSLKKKLESAAKSIRNELNPKTIDLEFNEADLKEQES